MPGQKGKKGRGRAISKVKRNNQRRNKLIKRGEIKPKTTSKTPWHQNQQRDHADKKRARDEKKVGGKRKAEEDDLDREAEEEEAEFDPDDMMSPEDALMLAGGVRSKSSKKQKLEDFETSALRRYEEDREGETKTKSLLPIKTKKGGLILQEAKVADRDSDFEDGDTDGEGEENGEAEQEVEDVAGTEKSVLSLLSDRENILTELKLQVGSMASNFLENPQERIHLLEKLVGMLDKLNSCVKTTGYKLVSSTVNELLKDVIPSYAVDSHHVGAGPDVKLKKETMALQGFEKGLLQCAKDFLVKLEKNLQGKKANQTSTLGSHSIKCMSDLLVAHPQFNYAPNMINLLVPYLNSRDEASRSTVKTAIEAVFRGDKKGATSKVVVSCIKKVAKARNFNVHPDLIDCMLRLKLSYVPRFDPEAEEEKRRKKKQHEQLKRLSKKEKKRQKQLKALEKELLEAKGEESKAEREKNFTEVAKMLFEMLFSIIKNIQHVRLLPPTLKCISTHCHAINVDFFHDLLKVLSDLMRKEDLGVVNRVLCVKSTFDILTGPGEFLTYDPGSATKTLIELMPTLDASQKGMAEPICANLINAVVKRKKHVSKDLVKAFAKALASAALHADSEDSTRYLECLIQIRNAHFSTYESLLSSDEDMLAAPCTMSGSSSPGFGMGSLWELNLLQKHLEEPTAKLAAKLAIVKNG